MLEICLQLYNYFTYIFSTSSVHASDGCANTSNNRQIRIHLIRMLLLLFFYLHRWFPANPPPPAPYLSLLDLQHVVCYFSAHHCGKANFLVANQLNKKIHTASRLSLSPAASNHHISVLSNQTLSSFQYTPNRNIQSTRSQFLVPTITHATYLHLDAASSYTNTIATLLITIHPHKYIEAIPNHNPIDKYIQFD